MASASPLFFLIITLFIPHSSSSQSQSQSQMLLLSLTHSLSQSNTTTTHHLLKTTTTRSFTRFRRHHHHRNNNHPPPQLSLPLSPGSDYTLSFTISSHPITLYMDTGSDLIWFPCSPFTCILCDLNNNNHHPTTQPSLPRIPQNDTVPCHSASCSAAHSNTLSSSDLCATSHCPLDKIETNDCSSFKCPPFYYAYGDGSLIATLYKHTISLSSSLHLKNFTFGCAHTTLNEPVGVAGFGRGLLSLPAQIATFAPQLGNRFSYCLVSHSFDSERIKRPSPLILGRYDDKQRNNNGEVDDEEFVYTPMLENHKHSYFYTVGLVAIAVGKRVIPAPEMLRRVDAKGNGGVVVDSGTTFTMLPAGFYDSVVAEFDRRVGIVRERASRVERNTGLKPCYYFDGGEKMEGVPAMKLHFGGGNYSTVAMPRKNYFYEFLDGGDEAVGEKRRRVGCLMLMNGGDDSELSGGPGATLGNYQQQGFEVVYDLEKKRVGFAKRQCASLWEKLSRENN